MSNGARSKQRDGEYPEKFDHIMPAREMIRSVEIYHTDCIWGFIFFDNDHTEIWQIGSTQSWMNVKKVLLDKNEVIVGVVGKLRSNY